MAINWIIQKCWHWSDIPFIHLQHHPPGVFNMHSEHSAHWSAAAGTSQQSVLANQLPLQRKKISPLQIKTHHSLFIYMPGRVYFIVNVWLTTLLLNNDWKHAKMPIIFFFYESTRLSLWRFKIKLHLTRNSSMECFSSEMVQEALLKVN